MVVCACVCARVCVYVKLYLPSINNIVGIFAFLFQNLARPWHRHLFSRHWPPAIDRIWLCVVCVRAREKDSVNACVHVRPCVWERVRNFDVFIVMRFHDVIGWLWSVGSIKLYVSFAEYHLFYRALLQNRPIILSILLTVATAYIIILILLFEMIGLFCRISSLF